MMDAHRFMDGTAGSWLPRRWAVGLALLLCLCVFLQMLGVPAPLLNAGGSFDMGGSSVQEGWSIHSSHVDLPRASCYALIDESHRAICVPLFAEALFRPPLS
jgi:hypothetical protein